MDADREVLPFRALGPWLRETFGRRVRRVALDAGSSCPNRDGTKGRGGCAYCDVEGSGTGALRRGVDLERQLREGLARIRRRDPERGAIAYFQSYSNTYVSPERLEEVLLVVDPYLGREVVALSVATRPDTLPEWALAALERRRERAPVWVELGLEAADDGILERINRLHTVDDFRDACARARSRGLSVVGHAILGLPGDGREGASRTARLMAECRVDGVKVHQLMVLERTLLAKWWRDGEVAVLEPDEYVSWLADFVERLSPEQVVHRVAGDAVSGELLAPRWTIGRNEIRSRLVSELDRRGTRQGSAVGCG